MRKLKKKTENTREAVGIAIDMHPDDSPIKRILEDNRAEVAEMFMFEFDEKEYREVIKEEAREEGLLEGREKGFAEGRNTQARYTNEQMREAGLGIEQRSRMLGFPEEELRKWDDQSKKL